MDKYSFFTHVIVTIVLLCALPGNIVSQIPPGADDGDIARIVGGYRATIQEFPYQAFMTFYKGSNIFVCGGSIISSEYILTAAHCTAGTTQIKVRVGSTFANSGGWVYTTQLFGAHPFYNPITFDYDVALVRILPQMTLDGINAWTIQLPPPESFVLPGTIIVVSGWGAQWEGGTGTNHLMAVNLPVVSSLECQKTYYTFTSRMICAGIPQGGKDVCQGDSGGAAVSVTDGVQIGIVSWGVGCAEPGFPGVYTDVASVRGWIQWMSGL